MSHREIAEKSGLSKSTVSDLSRRTSWNGIDIDTVVAFSQACGIDLLRTGKLRDSVKRRGLGSAAFRGGGNERRMNATLLELLKSK